MFLYIIQENLQFLNYQTRRKNVMLMKLTKKATILMRIDKNNVFKTIRMNTIDIEFIFCSFPMQNQGDGEFRL